MRRLRAFCRSRFTARGRYCRQVLRRAEADGFNHAAERLVDVINGGSR